MHETDEQGIIVAWFRSTWPEHGMCIRASQSGRRSGSPRRAAIAWASQVKMGAVGGESDLAFLIARGRFGCLVLEHKAEGSAHDATPDQLAYLEYHRSIGNCAVLTRGVEAAQLAIQQYMCLPRVSG